MKRLIALLLTGVMALSIVGCSSSTETASTATESTATTTEAATEATEAAVEATGGDYDDITIGISMATLQEERWQKDRDYVIEELVALGIKEENIFVESADNDEAKQVSQSENMITKGIDALIIFPSNGDACVPIVNSAHEAGIQVISVDRIINNSDLDFYITYDATQIGRIQGEYITETMGVTSGNWVMLQGAPQDPNAQLIRNGQMEYVQQYIDSGDITVVMDQTIDNWTSDIALTYTENALTANNNDIDVVFTSNDGCAGAAIVALEDQGMAGSVPVPGLDAELAACQRIVAGTQSMTVYRKLSVMDILAAKVGFAMATGQDIATVVGDAAEITTKDNGQKDVPSILLTDPSMMFAVDADNMEEVVKDGWLDAADIYANVDPSEWPAWTANY